MNAFTDALLQRYMVRHSRQQKIDFTYFAAKAFNQNGYTPTLQRRNPFGIETQNLILGNPATAKYIFAAPYDTPARKLYPYVKFFANPALAFTLFLLPIFTILFFLLLICTVFLWPYYFAVPMGIALIFLCNWAIPNKANANCTCSGIMLLAQLSGTQNPHLCFVLYDNAAYGHLGLHTFIKQYAPKCPIIRIEEVGQGPFVLCRHTKSTAALLPQQSAVRYTKKRGKKQQIALASVYKNKLGYYVPHIKSPLDTSVNEPSLTRVYQFIQEMLLYANTK